MKMIKITTENQISVHDFPEGSFEAQNEAIREHIGPKCELYEHVMPRRLYSELHASGKRGNGVSMLVDEDGYYHNLPENIVASWLYESDKHGYPILGNVLIASNNTIVASINIPLKSGCACFAKQQINCPLFRSYGLSTLIGSGVFSITEILFSS